jgi:hypothetical protein
MTMSEVFWLMMYVGPFSLIGAAVLYISRRFEGRPSRKLFKNHLKLIGIGVLASMFPFLHIGAIMGFPSVLLASTMIVLIFSKELE